MASDARYGGQAIIEGVMIRGVNHVSMAVRAPDGRIRTRCRQLNGIYTGPLRDVPFLRGTIVLWETLVLGMKALMFSSNVAAGIASDADEDEVPDGDRRLWLMVILSLGLVGSLFFAGPVLLTHWLGQHLPGTAVVAIEGILRLTLLVAYVWAIGHMKELRRVFAYHGAEHKAVAAWEHQRELTIEQVRAFSPAHPRCGTAFLLTVMLISLVLFIAVGAVPFELRLASRIAFLPVVAAIAYEVIRAAAKHDGAWWAGLISAPNLLLQRLTTSEPDDEQIEVAIAAMKAAVSADASQPVADLALLATPAEMATVEPSSTAPGL